MTVVVSLGDSLTCGEGVGLRLPPSQTWAAQVASALPGGALLPLAAPGARLADVRARQLPRAHSAGARVATVLAGLNDVARSGFDAGGVRRDLLAVVHALSSAGVTVLLGRLHDPTRRLPLPGPVRQLGRERVGAVNAAVDEAADDPGVHVLDLAAVPALAEPSGWAVDRVHPSAAGHAGMAAAAAEVLAAAGWSVAPPPPPVPVPVTAPWRGAATGLWWLTAHGAPYAARHARELGSPVLTGLRRRS